MSPYGYANFGIAFGLGEMNMPTQRNALELGFSWTRARCSNILTAIYAQAYLWWERHGAFGSQAQVLLVP